MVVHPRLSSFVLEPDDFPRNHPSFLNTQIHSSLGTDPIKLVEQLDQSSFFYAGDIGAGDAQFFCNFPLGLLLASGQAEPVSDHILFPFVQNVQITVDFTLFDLQLDRLHNFIPIRPQYIDQGDFINIYSLSVKVFRKWRVYQGGLKQEMQTGHLPIHGRISLTVFFVTCIEKWRSILFYFQQYKGKIPKGETSIWIYSTL